MTRTKSKTLRLVHTEASLGWGGQEIRILTETLGMIQRGHDVTLLCPPEARISEEARLLNLPVVALPIGRKNLKGLLALYRWLSGNHADVINTHSSTDSWLAALASKLLKIPPPMVRTRHISAAIPKNFPTRWLYQTATSHIITTGGNLRRQLIDDNKYDPAHITSVPTGIDLKHYIPGDKNSARSKLGLPECRAVIGIVATLRSWKGHRYLIQAFSMLVDPGLRLVIVGDGPVRESLKQQINELKLDAQVFVVGNQRDVLPWLHAMDVFVLPSYANEGVPQALMQAMACGLPVISTPIGSITEIIENGVNGILVEPLNVTELHDTIRRVLADSEYRYELSTKALESARKNFGVEKMLDKMEAMFTDVCVSHG